jgi:hypothetical protein
LEGLQKISKKSGAQSPAIERATILAHSRKMTLNWSVSVVVIAVAFAYFNTSIAVNYAEFPPIGGDVKNIIQMIQKYDDPLLFSRDFAFADDGYKLYVPAYINLVRFINKATETFNYERSIHYLMFPICVLFVLSMAWLLWRITGQRWLSLVMALCATLSLEIIYGNLTYSIGIYVTPRFLHLAIAPLLFGLLLFYGNNRLWGPVVFLVVGLSCNLHFGSGVSLFFAFILAWFLYDLYGKQAGKKLLHWTLCGLAAMLGALPYLLAYKSGQVMFEGSEVSSASPEVFNAMLHTRYLFYPMDIFADGQLHWPIWSVRLVKFFFYAYPLIVIANLVLHFAKQERGAYFLLYFANLVFMKLVAADESWTIVATMILPMLLLGISDLVQQRKPNFIRVLLVYLVPGIALLGTIFSVWVVDIVQALDLYMPAFYYDLGVAIKYIPFMLNIYLAILLAEAVSAVRLQLPRKALEKKPLWYMLVLVALTVSLIYRFIQTPYNGYNHYRNGYAGRSHAKAMLFGQQIFDPEIYPSPIQRDYRDATTWVKAQTPKDVLFLVLTKEPSHDFMFRYKTRRSMWVCYKDGGIDFYKGRDSFVRWYREFQAREQALAAQSPEAVMEYALSRRIDYIFVDKQNYEWLAAAGLETVFENRSYLVIKV